MQTATTIQKPKIYYRPVGCYNCGEDISPNYMRPSDIGSDPSDLCGPCEADSPDYSIDY